MSDDLEWRSFRGPSNEDKSRYQNKLALIKEKCERFEIPVLTSQHGGGWEASLTISLPDGRSRRDIQVIDLEDADWPLSFAFEDFYFIPNYGAVCNYKQSLIISSINVTGFSSF